MTREKGDAGSGSAQGAPDGTANDGEVARELERRIVDPGASTPRSAVGSVPASGRESGGTVDVASLVLAAWDRSEAPEPPRWASRPLAGWWFRGAALEGPPRRTFEALARGALARGALAPWLAVDSRDLDRNGWPGVLDAPPPRASEIGFELLEGGEPLEATLAALELGRALVFAGVGLFFGPSLHLSFGPDGDDPGAGAVEAFGPDPREVAYAAGLVIEGLQAAGLLVVPGEFPGVDPRAVSAPEWTPDQLEVTATPFASVFSKGGEAVRVTAVTVPAWDPDRPAHASPSVVADRLCADLAFGGMVVGVVPATSGDGREAVDMVAAGVDLLAVPSTEQVPTVLHALEGAVDSGALSVARVRAAAARVTRARADWA